MNSQEKLEALQTYFALMSMNGGTRLFHIAHQMGVFTPMQKGLAGVADISAACGTLERPTQLLLDGLCSLNIVKQTGEKYTLAPVMQFFAGNYQDLSNRYWDHLPEYLKSGVPIARMDDPSESEKQYQAQVTALDSMMRPSAEVAAHILGIGDKLTGLDILDVGCGSAVWSLAMAQKDAQSTVTAMDWPGVLDIARSSAERMGLLDRFTPLPGNYHDTELKDDAYNLIIVGNVTHLETEPGNKALFEKLLSALKPGGRLVIFDVFGDQERGKLHSALYAIGLALRTTQGQVYPIEHLQSFMAAAGFTNLTYVPLEITPYTMGMLIGEKESDA